MTDDEAKGLLAMLMLPCPAVSVERRQEAIRHALRAIEDRAALVGEIAVHVYGSKPSPTTESFLAARRHMKGEE